MALWVVLDVVLFVVVLPVVALLGLRVLRPAARLRRQVEDLAERVAQVDGNDQLADEIVDTRRLADAARSRLDAYAGSERRR